MKKLKRLPKPARATTSTSPDTKSKPIRFSVNVIIPATTPKERVAGNSRLVVAGQPSPYYDIESVPLSLRGFIGEPPPSLDTSDWERQQEEIVASFSPVSESVAAELNRRQAQEIEDAVARNAISTQAAIRETEFFDEVQRERDIETAELYEAL
jgi:hypothetical protein